MTLVLIMLSELLLEIHALLSLMIAPVDYFIPFTGELGRATRQEPLAS